MIEFLSQLYRLEPGDLVFTGTPAGVGAGRRRRSARRPHRRPDAARDRNRARRRIDHGVVTGHDDDADRARLQQPRSSSRPSALARRVGRALRARRGRRLRPSIDVRYGTGRRRRSTCSCRRSRRAARCCSFMAASGARSTRRITRSSRRRSSTPASPSRSSTTTCVPASAIANDRRAVPAGACRGSCAKARHAARRRRS